MEPTEFPAEWEETVIYFQIVNDGDAASRACTARLVLDNNADSKEISLPPYAVGQFDIIAQGINGLPSGEHFIYVYLDWHNQVPEKSKANNTGFHDWMVG